MLVKFKITFEDGTSMESHDECYNEIKSHSHALPPHSNKKWSSYEIISDEGHHLAVNFLTGMIIINGVQIHLADENGTPLTFLEDKQEYPATDGRAILNGMPYYPIFGKRIVTGNFGRAEIPFCGWKRKVDGRAVEKIMFLYPNGQIVLQ